MRSAGGEAPRGNARRAGGVGLAALTAVAIAAGAELPPSEPLSELLRQRVELAAGTEDDDRESGPILARRVLPRFYEGRSFAPAWVEPGGPRPQARRMAEVIRAAEREGLRPDGYHLERIDELLSEANGRDPARLATLDLLLTDAALVYAAHLLAGRLDPETIDPEWHASRRDADLALFLEEALRRADLERSYAELLPQYPAYARLKQVLADYRRLLAAGGWPAVPGGPTLRLGDRDNRVASLRQRLYASGDLSGAEGLDPRLFDAELEVAVRRFQSRHGLAADGAVGPATVAAMAHPLELRVRQLVVNLERWRWLPQALGERYVLVNLAGFDLRAVAEVGVDLEMRVVVGRPYSRTPVFSNRISYLVFNPYWNVPSAIARELVAKVRRDPDYFRSEGIRVYRDWEAAEEVDPATVDWTAPSGKLRFFFRQDPGPKNALGRIKFMFPNRFNVYLHDTPDRRAFDQTVRTLSHGCIRVERPIDLAEWLLSSEPGWSRERIRSMIERGAQTAVGLEEPVPVHMLYWTAWVDDEGVLQFRDDVYGRDEAVYQALFEAPTEGDGGFV